MTSLIPITNTPRDYAWGAVDGVSRALGRPGSGGPEAELWLGAHPLSPSRRTTAGDWVDLAEWEASASQPLPFLLKVLAAAHPLSLQAHPTPEQAAAGFAREDAAGIPLSARERNYKDPHAKPELIVAVDDGFEALWLPAGNIHAYLRGTGVELMGPSDNVLRGGLTPKHVDRGELRTVLDFTPGPPPRLVPVEVSEHVVSYRPASTASGRDVDFELLLVTGDASFATGSPAIAVVLEGRFALDTTDASAHLDRGDIVFVDAPAALRASGSGRLFVATGTRA